MSDNVSVVSRDDSGVAVVGDATVNPATGRPAGRVEAAILLLASCLSVLGAVLLAPVLPSIERAFAGTAGVDVLTPLVLTAPALLIGLTASFAGRVVDRVGRKGLLVGALVVYAVVGTAPLYLPTLQLVVVSRVLVGLTEAAIMTCCTTLLADYFHGRRREHMFGLQVVVTSVSATVFFGVGGALGASGWRTPFWLYAVSLPLAALVARFVWQPQHRPGGVLPALPWRVFLPPVLVTLLGGVVFYVLIVELSFRLDDIGVTSPATIGLASVLSSAATAVMAFAFGRLARLGPAVLVPVAFVLCGTGHIGMGLAGSLPLVVAAAVVAGLGNGLILPALLTWALSRLSFSQRGRGTGVWTSALFVGQFVCPLVVLAISGATGGLGGALVVLGVTALVAAAAVRVMSPGVADAVAR